MRMCPQVSARSPRNKYAYLPKWVRRTNESVCVYLQKCLPRTHASEYVVFILLLLLLKRPNGAILLHSPGRKPWVMVCESIVELRWGAALPAQSCVWSLDYVCCVVLYLSVGAFACVGKCRPCTAHCRIGGIVWWYWLLVRSGNEPQRGNTYIRFQESKK